MKSGQLFTAMITPMNKDQSVNYGAAVELARRLAENGSDGVVLSGTTGESPTLSFEEKVKLFSEVTDALGGQVEIIAGTGSNSTDDSIALTKAAENSGVDGIMLVAPYYNKPSQEGLYEHFKAIALQTSLPVMIYNVPGRTSVNILPETVARLAKIDNIVAIKEASGSLEQVSVLKTLVPDDFLIYSGDDALTLPILSVGGAGVVSVVSHLVGREIKAMISAFCAGKTQEALETHLQLMPLFKAMFLTTNPVPVKRALEFVGFETGPVRLPLADLTEAEAATIKGVLAKMGLGS
ncbi:MAG: 4-hydroxy-tetrahydrodipicolinate synthase [Bacillota bacterium]|jgi:4-hydroxy-tetrahydrodipicolinate synthase|nr:4-hydroxy-tetrahydrodipicolinate synthase [Bacillota bacterium]HHT91422.1 4-hydroxy-tetrahydrodipicolinate synthase [Bacillota bacterium]